MPDLVLDAYVPGLRKRLRKKGYNDMMIRNMVHVLTVEEYDHSDA